MGLKSMMLSIWHYLVLLSLQNGCVANDSGVDKLYIIQAWYKSPEHADGQIWAGKNQIKYN